MALVLPFKAVRPHKNFVSQVAALPYDVMTREEALLKEEAEINRKMAPPELTKFLNDNNLTMASYEEAVKHADKSQYERLVLMKPGAPGTCPGRGSAQ